MGQLSKFAASIFVAAWLAALLRLTSAAAAEPAFQQWLDELWPQAQAMGVSRKTFEAATRGLEPDLTLPDLDLPGRPGAPPRGQAEFVQTPADYIKEANDRPARRAGARSFRPSTARRSRRSSRNSACRRNMLLAIWGRETAFGGYKLPHERHPRAGDAGLLRPAQGHVPQELLYALKMLEEGHVKLADMRSSWGGAMGLTQFLPSEFYKHAVDFDGDGKKDIWTSVPDALASAAQQLVNKGWQRGTRWAYEVRAPASVDCTIGVPASRSRSANGCSRATRRPMARKPSRRRAGRTGVAAAAGRHLRPGVPDARRTTT